ncbi:hypothetical protein CFP56_000888 [Quercus suber]|uniref:Uncharacterized protein n=1 Tax=Quercus suber TaxID=58331 RepID=A0AAW0LHU2_QUESU
MPHSLFATLGSRSSGGHGCSVAVGMDVGREQNLIRVMLSSFWMNIHHSLIPNKNIKIQTKEIQTNFKLMDYYIVFLLILPFVWASIHVFTSNLASRKSGLPTTPQ